MDPKTRIMAVKIISSQHLQSFLDGNLFMNRPSFFRREDLKDPVRSDPDEGIHSTIQFNSLYRKNTSAQWAQIEGLQGPLILRTVESSDYNMFCMYVFTDQHTDNFDSQNLLFGDTFILISNIAEFIRRVKIASKKIKRICYHGAIEYVERTTHDDIMGPFKKFNNYSYQNEFRIALMNGDDEPLTLSIGDIRDICIVGATQDLHEVIAEIRQTGGLRTELRDSEDSKKI